MSHALGPGSRVGRYEIRDLLGEGGMGRVYRAWDPSLEREVALKVLPGGLAEDRQRLARFEQEARATAALNHPNILAVHDVGTGEGGAPFLVTELLVGKTLRELLRERRLSVAEAVELARQAARGLAAAHERGIVHRDLKPENLFVTREGSLKILDFGLAKLREGVPGDDQATQVARDTAVTGASVMLGTPAYMSPEQIRGEPVDGRTDLFALGLVLYEMVAGLAAFAAETVPEVLTAILRQEPPELSTLEPSLPPGLERIIRHCLEKQPDRRFQSASDLAFDLEMLSASGLATTTGGTAAAASPRRLWRPLLLAGALVALGGLLAWVLLARRAAPPPAPQEAGRVAVFPFAVRGPESVAYLREGLVDLTSAALDGLGDLRAVDTHALLRAAPAGEELTPETAARIAGGFGAPLYVLGSLVAVGDAWQLQASLYEGDRRAAAADLAAAGEADLLAGVDRLARDLVAERLGQPAERLARQGLLTARPLAAVRAYLAGERAFRAGNWAAAREAFEEALRLEPDFALAHFRLAAAAVWFEEDGQAISVREAAAAMGGADQLPERERALLAALDAYVNGRADEAEELYRNHLRAYPDEVEAWYGLGEVLTHHNPIRGRPKWEGRESFERVVELDPSHAPSAYHLIQAAAHERRLVDLDELSTRYADLFAGNDEIQTRIRTWRAYLLGGEAERQALLEDLAAGKVRDPGLVVWTVLHELQDAEGGAALLRRGLEVAPPERHQELYLDLAMAALARGRLAEAREALRRGDAMRSAGDPPGSLLLADYAFLLPIGEAELRAFDRDAAGWTPPEVWDWETHATHAALLRAYERGKLAVRLGDVAAARRFAAELPALSRDAEGRRLAASLAHTLEALVLAQRGESAAGLAEVERAQLEAPARILNNSGFYGQFDPHLLRAELLDRLGRGEEALAWFQSLEETCCFENLVYAPHSHLRRAQILERLGRPEEAAGHYARFLDSWKDADPELQPLVREAEGRLAALAARKG